MHTTLTLTNPFDPLQDTESILIDNPWAETIRIHMGPAMEIHCRDKKIVYSKGLEHKS